MKSKDISLCSFLLHKMHINIVWARRGKENSNILKESKSVNLKHIDTMMFLKIKSSANDWASIITIVVIISSKRNDQV